MKNVGKISLAIFLIIIGFIGFIYFLSQLVPYSVSVSGYTRRDGTYVHSYSRRPPGTAKGDDFIGFLELASLIPVVCGIVSIRNAIKNQKNNVRKNGNQIENEKYHNNSYFRSSIEKNSVNEVAKAYRSELLNKIQEAIDGKNEISFRYTKENGSDKMRLIIPKRIKLNYVEDRPTGKYYIIGFDLNRNAERVFREDRISELIIWDK